MGVGTLHHASKEKGEREEGRERRRFRKLPLCDQILVLIK